jgi:hypothetical protein
MAQKTTWTSSSCLFLCEEAQFSLTSESVTGFGDNTFVHERLQRPLHKPPLLTQAAGKLPPSSYGLAGTVANLRPYPRNFVNSSMASNAFPGRKSVDSVNPLAQATSARPIVGFVPGTLSIHATELYTKAGRSSTSLYPCTPLASTCMMH